MSTAGRKFNSSAGRRDPLAGLATVGAVVLLGLTVAWHARGLLEGRAEPDGQPVAPAEVAAPTAPQADLGVLAAWHPFGAPATPAGTVMPVVVEQTPLNVKLHGVVAGPTKESGRAIIADESGVEKSYTVGEAIVEGAVLAGVETRKVIIRRGDKLESLPLPEITTGAPEAVPPEVPLPTAIITPPAEQPVPEMPLETGAEFEQPVDEASPQAPKTGAIDAPPMTAEPAVPQPLLPPDEPVQ
ncbi:MAG: type II secretion system protein N [Gammaproteobacteria bacterium]